MFISFNCACDAQSLVVIPVATQAATPDIPEGAILIFYEDFDDYEGGTNLLNSTGSSILTKTVNGEEVKIIDFTQKTSADLTTHQAIITDATADGFTGKTLKITTDSENIKAVIYIANEKAIDTETAGNAENPNPYYGKQLVYEFNTKLVGSQSESDFMKIGSASGATSRKPYPFMQASGTAWVIRDGTYPSGNLYHYTHSDAKNKTKFRVVIDRSGDVDLVRTYNNGALVSAKVTRESSPYYGNTIKDFAGEYYNGGEGVTRNFGAIGSLISNLKPKTAGTARTAYIDDILIYAVDPIEFDGLVSNNVMVSAGVGVKFDQPFNATVDTFQIRDSEGAVVENAIIDVDMSADKKTATVE